MSNQKTKIIIETDAGRSEQVLRSVQKGLSGVGNEANDAGKKTKSSGSLMEAVFSKTALAVAGLGVAFKSAYSMAKEASQLSEARLYLQSTVADMGMSYDALQAATKKASNGMVDNLTLIQLNHKALRQGVTTDINELSRLWQIADAIGDVHGQSIEQTFEQITRAISEGNERSLISLGLLPESFKRASDSATLLQRRTEILKNVLSQSGAFVDKLSEHGDTATDKFQKFDVAVKDLKSSLGEGLIPIFTPVVEGLTDIANAIDETINAADRVKNITKSQGAAGRLAEISELKSGLINQQRAIEKAGQYILPKPSAMSAEEDYKTTLDMLAAHTLKSSGINIGAGEEIDKVIEREKKRIDIQLRALETEKEQVKEAGRLTAAKERNLAVTKAAADAAKAEAEAKKRTVEEQKEAAKIAEKQFKEAMQARDALERARREAQKNLYDVSVGDYKRKLDSISVIPDPIKRFNEAAKLAESAAASLAAAIGSPNGTSLFSSLSDVSSVAEEMGSSISTVFAKLKNEAGEAENTIKEFKSAFDLVQNSNVMLWKEPNSMEAMLSLANWHSGGLFAAGGNAGKNALNDIKEPLSKTIAEAVQAGFANADFSNLSLTLGSILSDVISKSVAQSNPVISSTGGINWGNLGTNIAVNWAVGRLTGAGGLFGKRKENGKEAVQQAATLREQMGQTYLKSYETQNLAYLYGNGGSGYLNALNSGRNAYFGTYVGYNWNDSGDGIFSKKTRTYELVDQGASSALKKLTEAIERAEKFNRNVERGYELMIAEGNDFKALVEQALVYQNAAAYAIGGERSLNWTDGSRDTADLAESAHDIKVAAAELARQLGQAKAERSTSIAQGFAKYAPWLSMMQLPNAVTTTSGLGGYNPMIPGGGHVRMISSYPIVDMNTLGVGEQYDAFSALQEKFMDREISPYMIEMIKQSGSSMFGLEKLKFSDPDSYSEKYLEYVEKQISAFDEIMKRQEQIFQDAARTYEERSAALQTFERAQESYYQAKLDTLAAEQAAEEAVKRKQQEADLRRMETMEAALSLTGEIAQRGDKIIVIQGGDTSKAVRELLGRYSDDPEMTSILQGLLKIADDKARWGK